MKMMIGAWICIFGMLLAVVSITMHVPGEAAPLVQDSEDAALSAQPGPVPSSEAADLNAGGTREGVPAPFVANPVNVGTGQKYEEALDVSFSTPGIPLEFKRSYNSSMLSDGPLGYGWTHTYNMSVTVVTNWTIGGVTTPVRIKVMDSDGRALYFSRIFQTYTDELRFYGESGVRHRFKKIISTGQYVLRKSDSNLTYTFGTDGKLTSITDPSGNSLTLTYTSDLVTDITDNYGRSLTIAYSGTKISSVTDPKSQQVTYTYTSSDLTQVSYPDSRSLSYAYSSHRMTDKYDTSSNLIGHWAYDANGRVSTYYRFVRDTVNQEQITFTYDYTSTPNTTTLTRSTGTTTYTTAINDGIRLVTAVDGCGSTCGGSLHKSFTYDTRGTLTDVTRTSESQAYTTHYTYDAPTSFWDYVGEVTSMKEAYGLAEERETTYAYTHRTDDPFLLTERSETKPSVVSTGQSKVITTAYDTAGNVSSVTVTGYVLVDGSPVQRTYTTSYQYNALGQLAEINGPRTDVTDTTTLAYYANTAEEGNNRGRLYTITNALGQVTTFSNYDANGNAGTITAPDGVVTVHTYDQRNRLLTSTNQSTNGQIQYFYDGRGNLSYVIPPEGNRIDYTYNLADRLTGIQDNQGNKITYSYDVEGNRTREEVRDPGNVLKKYLDLTYDAYNNIYRIVNPDSTYTQYTYNERSERTAVRNPRDNTTSFTWDALDRARTMTRPGSNLTSYNYDTQDNPSSIVDPNTFTTQYAYDDFGRLNQVVSPDTGTTKYVHDPAGNVTQMTDARSTVVNYGYDALNRITSVQFPSDSTQNITFTYDSTSVTYGIGRLTGRTDPSGTYTFSYDAQGNMVREDKVVNSVSYTTQYTYNKNNILTSVTYPSGRVVSYTMDTVQRVSQVSMTTQGTPVTLASSITYMPFGGIASLTYGNSLSLTQTWDNQYRLSSITAGSVLSLSYGYDASGNVTSITDTIGSAPGQYIDSTTYAYESGTNRLTTITGTPTATLTHDANGNIITEGTRTFTYDLTNRLTAVTDNETEIASYVYDARNLRVKKATPAETRIFHYDVNGHLIAETDTAGNTLVEYVYLSDMPLATVRPTDTVYYFHTDHINTPRVMTNSAGTVAWQAAYHGFGHAEVDGASTITNNIRFPGQYFDAETNLHYNWNRYYDPRTGRYLTPDPIGLEGGIDPYVYADTVGKPLLNEPNLFVYTNNSPMNRVDPKGLFVEVGVRTFYPYAVPYARHCFVRFNGRNDDTLSFTNQGIGPDANPGAAKFSPTVGCGSDACVRREMRKCRAFDYYLTMYNCCHCVATALENCGLSKAGSWPNRPRDASKPPYKRNRLFTVPSSAPDMMGRHENN